MTSNDEKVYIAAPYTKPDQALNVRRAMEIADRVVKAGGVPFIPHLSHFWHLVNPRELGWWYQYTLAWVRSCEHLVYADGESVGVGPEIAEAKRLNIPIWHESQITGDFRFENERHL